MRRESRREAVFPADGADHPDPVSEAMPDGIYVRDLCIRFPAASAAAVSAFSLTVAPGELVLLAGPTGCGKSSALSVLSGVIPHVVPARVSGTVRVAGGDPARRSLTDGARRTAHLFQNVGPQLFTDRVGDEVRLPLEFGAVPCADVDAAARSALADFGLTGMADRRVADLSSGYQQRLALAALHPGRKLALLLDEPFAFLDPRAARELGERLRQLRAAGLAILVAEHREALVLPMADRVVRMGEPHSTAPVRSTPRPPGGPCLIARDLRFSYGAGPILDGVDLTLRQGEGRVIVGANGSGKTTLCLVLAGVLAPGAGTVRVADRELRKLPARERAGRVALVLQNPDRQLFASSVLAEAGPAGASRLRAFGLWDFRDRHPRSLSYGQKRRLALARALARDPHVLIVDEPSVGQDAAHLESMFGIFQDYLGSGGALLVTSHDPRIVRGWGHGTMTLAAGRLAADRPVGESFFPGGAEPGTSAPRRERGGESP
ncbi:MAG: ATP-binding cassette domain-containing protein [Desulfococcaceae bacterium]